MNVPVLLLAAALLSCALTATVRALALSAKLLDMPNERSSHTVPTPRGGGIAIVLVFVLGMLLLPVVGVAIPQAMLGGLLVACTVVAACGAIDDRWQLRAGPRFLAHLAAAGWFIWGLGHLPPLPLPGLALDMTWIGPPLALLYLSWAINIFNFMDGIDGIAGLETVVVAAGGAGLNALVLGGHSWVPPALLAASVAGFLVWNWPPARIFMGDVGSGFLGVAVGAMTLGYAAQAPVLFWCWMILQGCFMVDATTTLLRRMRRGERPQQAHRTHAYQYAARRLGAHLPVTVAYGLVTLCWLLPMASLVAVGRLDGLWALLIAYGPLVALAYHFHAGARERQTC